MLLPYEKEIQQISCFPLWVPVKIKDIEISRGAMQSAYKDMKRISYDGNIIEYFCRYAAADILAVCSGSFRFEKDHDKSLGHYLRTLNDTLGFMHGFRNAALRAYLKGEQEISSVVKWIFLDEYEFEISQETLAQVIKETSDVFKHHANLNLKIP